MTKLQANRIYWPAWSRAAAVHGWRMSGGRLAGQRREDWGAGDTTALYGAIWNRAERTATAAHRAPQPDDFRHAIHWAALARDKSSKHLTSEDLDRVAAALRLLADPEDLAAMLEWLDPMKARHRRMKWFLAHRCRPDYLAAIRTDWRELEGDELENFYRLIKLRPNARLQTEKS